MKHRFSMILNVVFGVLCLLFLIYIFIGIQKENAHVAIVGSKEITKKNLDEALEKNYRSTMVNELINESLIEQQFEKENFKITEKDQLEQLNYVEMIDTKKNSLTDSKTVDFVNQYLMVKLLSENLGIINDDELKNFLDEQKEYNGDKIIKVREISGSHEKLTELETKINNPESMAKFISENDLKVSKNSIFSLYNDYDTDFSKSKIGDYIHIMNEQSPDMSIVLVDKIESTDSNILNIEKNRNTITNVYYSKNYPSIKIRLLNELQKLYVIKK